MTLVYNTARGSEDTGSVLADFNERFSRLCGPGLTERPFETATAAGGVRAERFRNAWGSYRALHAEETRPDERSLLSATFPANRMTLITSPVDKKPKAPTVERALLDLLASAEKSVLIETPYLIADEAVSAALRGISEKGVRCTVSASSPAAASLSDVLLMSVYLDRRAELLSTVTALYEHQGGAYKHIKGYVIDGRLTVVGSYNICRRSACINTELLLAIDSEPLAEQAAAMAEGHIAQSCRVGPDNSYERGGAQPAEGSPIQMALFRALGLLLRPLAPLF